MKKIILITIFLFFITTAGNVYASKIDLSNSFFGTGTQHTSLQTISTPIIGLVYIIAGLAVLFSFLIAGFKILQGNPKSLDEGRMIIIYAFGGILLLVSTYWLTDIIGVVIGTNPNSGSINSPPPPAGGGPGGGSPLPASPTAAATATAAPTPTILVGKALCDKYHCTSNNFNQKICFTAGYSSVTCTLVPIMGQTCQSCYYP